MEEQSIKLCLQKLDLVLIGMRHPLTKENLHQQRKLSILVRLISKRGMRVWKRAATVFEMTT